MKDSMKVLKNWLSPNSQSEADHEVGKCFFKNLLPFWRTLYKLHISGRILIFNYTLYTMSCNKYSSCGVVHRIRDLQHIFLVGYAAFILSSHRSAAIPPKRKTVIPWHMYPHVNDAWLRKMTLWRNTWMRQNIHVKWDAHIAHLKRQWNIVKIFLLRERKEARINREEARSILNKLSFTSVVVFCQKLFDAYTLA